jgi:hypothetical protein
LGWRALSRAMVSPGRYETGDTTSFNTIAPGGGVVAKVAAVEHMGTGGSNFSFTFGACQAPQD